MRCPKCSFISYDQVETCAKCGKNISSAADTLHGTTVSVPAPSFLQFEPREPEPQYEAESSFDEGADVSAEEEIVDFSMDDDGGTDIELGEEEVALDIGEEEPAVEEEPMLELGAEEEREEEASIDISDLAPSDEAVSEPEPEEEAGFEVLEEEPVEEVPAEEEGAREGAGLKDLKVDIDLEPSEAPKGKVMPSVKTGTALDDFDIDLGDLLTSKKE